MKRAAIFSAVVMQKSLVKRIEDCIEEDKKEKHDPRRRDGEGLRGPGEARRQARRRPARVVLHADHPERRRLRPEAVGAVIRREAALRHDHVLARRAVQVVLRQRRAHPHHQPVEGAGAQLQTPPRAPAGDRRPHRPAPPPPAAPPRRPSPPRPPPPRAPPAGGARRDARRRQAVLRARGRRQPPQVEGAAPRVEADAQLRLRDGARVQGGRVRPQRQVGAEAAAGDGVQPRARPREARGEGFRRREGEDVRRAAHPSRAALPRAAPRRPPHPPPHPLPPPPPRSYALFLADTVLITESGAPELLTERAPKAWADINYQLNDEEGDEDAGGASSSKGGRMGKVEIKESRTRNAGHGVNKHAETNEHLAAHQEELEDQMRTDALKRLQEHGDPTAGTSARARRRSRTATRTRTRRRRRAACSSSTRRTSTARRRRCSCP